MLAMLAAALALAVVDAPPLAGSPAPAAAAPANQPENDDGLEPGQRRIKVVCKDYVRTGTRFSKKTCVELDAYRRQQELDRQAFEETQNRPMVEIRRGN